VDVAGTTLGEAILLGHLVFARMGPGAVAAEIGELGARALPHVDGLLGDGESAIAFTGVALALRWAERLDEAEQCTSRAVELARRQGSTGHYANALALRSAVHRRAGRLLEAEADARLAVAAAVGGEWSFPTGAVALIGCLLDRGEAQEAGLLLLDSGLEGPILDAPPLLSALLVRMQVRVAQRDHVRGLEDWAEAVRRAERMRGVGASWIDDLAAVVDLRRMAGDGNGARAAAAQALALAQTWGTSGALGQALRLQARTDPSGDEEPAALLREAVAQLSESPLRLEHARALVDLGSALRRRGHRSEARAPLREGLDLAQQCGADGLAEHARGELRATGVRVQRAALRGRTR
jgi:tetratricopeptide (TPR) repeat protein